MSTTIDDRAKLDEIRRLHSPPPNDEAPFTCNECVKPWPCPTARLSAFVDLTDMRDIGPEEAQIRAQTGVGLSGVESPWVAKPYAQPKDRDPCPWCGKRH